MKAGRTYSWPQINKQDLEIIRCGILVKERKRREKCHQESTMNVSNEINCN